MKKMAFDHFYFFMSIDLLCDILLCELKESTVLVLPHTKLRDPKQFLSVIQGLA